VDIREVQIADYFDEAVPLMRSNWDETGFSFEFKPSKEWYVKAQEVGICFALAAFDKEEAMIGYVTAFVAPHQFNHGVKFCSTDALFIDKEHRSGLLAGRLIQKTEEIAQARGAQFIAWHTRAGTPLAKMMARREYTAMDHIVAKEF
jgi:predicted GNAT superfamily acetyltransferase